MSQRNHAEEQDSATDSKFYLPAGVSPSHGAGWPERLWALLFSHRV
ncbi:hypothetical protein [Haloarcula sp. Atlit-7R]|nr:hypothetical protein [Haloarcula sp. Atlit-7R]